ncbi:hypothetical protein [Trichocoleus sp. DQ-U1]|uniref:hypothetical protein n=1 Tax=Trichocoleus sp. DQ-U1 TaxID=2933926 RepID=UPI00329739EB
MSINLETFRKSLTYSVTAAVSDIVKDLREMATLDRASEAKQTEFGSLATKCVIGAITSIVIAFILMIVVGEMGDGFQLFGNIVTILLLFVGLGCTIVAIYAGIRRSKYSRLNLPNHRYALTEKILGMLERDMDKEAKVSVHLDLSPAHQKSKQIKTVAHPSKSGFKIDIFQDDWLKMEGQFLDKTRFVLTTSELNQTAYGWKTSRSGKSKYKTKSKAKGLDISLDLTYPQRRYGAIKVLNNEAVNAVKIPKLTKVKRMRVTDKGINLVVKMPPSMPWNEETLYQTITMMFLSLYQVLNLARMLSKAK